MPDSLLLQLDTERLQYLESYRAIAEAAMGGLALALSDRSTSKAECLQAFELWRHKLDALHTERLLVLESAQRAIQRGQPVPLPPAGVHRL